MSNPAQPAQTPDVSKVDQPEIFWRTKYRPTSLAQIRPFRRDVHKIFSGYVASNNIPHLMLVGPEGSGKMVLAEILARELLKAEYDLNVKILYADDPIGKEERKQSKRQGHISTKRIGSGAGSDRRFRPFIQMRVRPFVSTKKYGDSPFKILIIKDFHRLDVEQQAFRRIMEQYSSNCRMILITDRISGIIDPIISRCQIVLVPFVRTHFFNKILKSTCDKEQIKIKLDVLDNVRYMSRQNIGKALDLLQLTHFRFNEIEMEFLTKMNSEINKKAVFSLFSQTMRGNFKSLRKTLRDIFRNQSLSKNEILIELSRIITKLPLEREVRAYYLGLIAELDYKSLDSNNDEIQLSRLLTQMLLIGNIN